MKRIIIILYSLLPIILFGQVGRLDLRLIRRPGGGPSISITPTFLSPFSNVTGTASSPQQIVVTGSNLTANITVGAASGLQYSATSGGTYTSTFSFTPTSGSVSSSIWVRVAATTSAGSYSGNVSFSSTGATTQNCTYSATVSASGTPTNTASPTSLSGFNTQQGTASSAQSFSLSGSNLTANDVVNAPASWEVSTDNTNFFSSLTVPQSGGSVNSVAIYCRITSGAPVGNPSGNVTITSTGATTINVALSGTVTSAGVLDSAKFNLDTTQLQSGGGWTNVTGDPSKQVKTATAGVSNTIIFSTLSTSNWTPFNGQSANPNNGNTVNVTLPVPAQVLKEVWYSYQAGGSYNSANPKGRISGLNPSKQYILTLSGSASSAAFNMSTEFRALGDVLYGPITINMKQNLSSVASWTMSPDPSGNITIYLDPASGNNLAVIGYITIYQQN